MKTHPLAQYPLELSGPIPKCCVTRSNPTFLTFVMLEASLARCRHLVKGKVVDVGCGMRPYEFTYYSGAEEYIGVDYLSDRSRPDIVASALDLPLEEQSVDTVVSNELLEHVADPKLALSEMYRVLKPGGFLILTCPAYWPRHEVPYDFFRYPYDGILSLVEGAGFKLEELFCRGGTCAFLGQVLQHTGINLLRPRWVSALLNTLLLRCDRSRMNDSLTLGWTVVARRPS